jgi:hypothetical protein
MSAGAADIARAILSSTVSAKAVEVTKASVIEVAIILCLFIL